MTPIRTIGIAGVLALMVAACSGGPASSPSASATSESASNAPSIAATASAAATESQVALPTFELPNNAPELEALLPTEVNGIAMVTSSWTGPDFVSADAQGDQGFVDFLKEMGAQPDDVSVASATPKDMTGLAADPTSYTAVFAFRVKGADSAKLQDEMKTAMASDAGDSVTWSAETVGGKQVQVAKTAKDSEVNQSTYLYTLQDIVFAVISGSPDSAADALGKLP